MSRRKSFAEECAAAWRDFGNCPGTYLRLAMEGGAKRGAGQYVLLRTADQQIPASPMQLSTSILGGEGRGFDVKCPTIPFRSTPDSWPLGVAEIAVCAWQDQYGHHTTRTMKVSAQRTEARGVEEYVDDVGAPSMFIGGRNYSQRAYARITFPAQGWLRFLVRGTHAKNAIMTAVDQAGRKVARYRNTGLFYRPGSSVEIVVHPDRDLTLELMLAIKASAGWVTQYFVRPASGG